MYGSGRERHMLPAAAASQSKTCVIPVLMSAIPSSPVPTSGKVADLIHHPWTTYTELERVYNLIYGNRDHEDEVRGLKEAANCLTAWSLVKCRTAYRPEISALAAFLNAITQDRMQEHADDLILCSLYSTAIIRFCEVLRNYEFNSKLNRVTRTTFIKTMGNNRSDHAESLELPGWIVDLRHDAAHGDGVSLDLMRRATDVAMDWFNNNFWPIVLQDKRIDLQIDGIIDHAFSDATSFSPKAMTELCALLRHYSHSAVKFMVRSLLKATASSDVTLYQPNPKTVHLIEATANCGQIHLMLHNLIDHFDDDNNDKDVRAAAILWFAKLMEGMTQKSNRLHLLLAKYSNAESTRCPEIEVQFMKVLNHLLMNPSDAALKFVPCFKKLIPGRGAMIDRVREAMSTLTGTGLTRGSVGPDFEIKTIAHVQKGQPFDESAGRKLDFTETPNKRFKRC